jgi:hypothetical protein
LDQQDDLDARRPEQPRLVFDVLVARRRKRRFVGAARHNSRVMRLPFRRQQPAVFDFHGGVRRRDQDAEMAHRRGLLGGLALRPSADRGCAASAARAHSRNDFQRRATMRALLAVGLLTFAVPLLLLPGCTPAIPEKDDFGNNALVPVDGIPPELASFNRFDPQINPLIAQQMCATPYQPLQDRNLGASIGSLDEERGRCQTHIPLIGP